MYYDFPLENYRQFFLYPSSKLNIIYSTFLYVSPLYFNNCFRNSSYFLHSVKIRIRETNIFLIPTGIILQFSKSRGLFYSRQASKLRNYHGIRFSPPVARRVSDVKESREVRRSVERGERGRGRRRKKGAPQSQVFTRVLPRARSESRRRRRKSGRGADWWLPEGLLILWKSAPPRHI